MRNKHTKYAMFLMILTTLILSTTAKSQYARSVDGDFYQARPSSTINSDYLTKKQKEYTNTRACAAVWLGFMGAGSYKMWTTSVGKHPEKIKHDSRFLVFSALTSVASLYFSSSFVYKKFDSRNRQIRKIQELEKNKSKEKLLCNSDNK